MQAWARDAKCAEFVAHAGSAAAEIWDSGKPENLNRDLALAICKECPVTKECAEYAASFERYGHVHGIYGGMKERERNAIYALQIPEPVRCDICGEATSHRAIRLCEAHYRQWRNYSKHREHATLDHFVARTVRREKQAKRKVKV